MGYPLLASVEGFTPYLYRARVTRVYDGDTLFVELDYGRNLVERDVRIRLYGVQAPELRGDERALGVKVRDWLANRIGGKDVLLESIKDRSGKYGRLLGRVWLEGVCVNDEMLKLGLVKEYKG